MNKKEVKKEEKPRKVRATKYETKVKIKGTLDEVLKVMVSGTAPTLKKHKGNKKT